MSEFTDNLRENAKANLLHAVIYLVRLCTGVILGLTVALTAQNMREMNTLIFVFIVMMITALLLRLTRGWGLVAVVIMMLVLSLVGVLLKLYIHTAAVG